MSEKIRWGILGTGWIADRFVEALGALDDAEAYAVASRSHERSRKFAAERGIPLSYGRYRDLADDPHVDIVYIATPHVVHAENALLALRAGKPVLCEKPFTLNATEAQRVIDEARARNLFLMEAMWTRFVPAVAKLREIIVSGLIGEIRSMTADIGWKQPYDPENRLYSPDLGGGALLDLGVYPVSLSSLLLGPPVRVAAVAHRAPTGVDGQCAVSLIHKDGSVAAFVASLPCDTSREATLVGTRGWIRIHAPITHPERLTLWSSEGTPTEYHLPHRGNGYTHQVIEAMRCLRAGRSESEMMPLDESLSIMKTLDRIRKVIGLVYPADSASLNEEGS